MSERDTDFNWTIEEDAMWPPRGRPVAPFGPTALEIIRSCPLRACFEASQGYERRTGYAACVGTVLHRTLQSLAEHPPFGKSDAEKMEEARRRFLQELEAQETERVNRPRERGLPRDEARVSLAIERVTEQALRMAQSGAITHSDAPSKVDWGSLTTNGEVEEPEAVSEQLLVEVEVPVKSSDGLLYGRIDQAEHRPGGMHLVDYKSALRTDLPERYKRQVQLYALLWHETRGEWPASGEVIYLLSGSVYPVSVEPGICERLGSESRGIISSLRKAPSADQLATPGDVCSICEFRPWCKPFWRWQASEPSRLVALKRATLGFEGKIARVEAKGLHWKLLLRWRDCNIRIVAPLERFPQLRHARVGMRVRALEMRLHGQLAQPQAIVTEVSELFLLG